MGGSFLEGNLVGGSFLEENRSNVSSAGASSNKYSAQLEYVLGLQARHVTVGASAPEAQNQHTLF